MLGITSAGVQAKSNQTENIARRKRAQEQRMKDGGELDESEFAPTTIAGRRRLNKTMAMKKKLDTLTRDVQITLYEKEVGKQLDTAETESKASIKLFKTERSTMAYYDLCARHKLTRICIFVLVQWIAMGALLEVPWDGTTLLYDENSPYIYYFEVIQSLVCGSLVVFMYDYYKLLCDIDAVQYRQQSAEPVFSSPRKWMCILELCIMAYHSVPGYKMRRSSLFVLFKFYLFLRLYKENSTIYRVRYQIFANPKMKRVCRPVVFDTWFVLRVLFYEQFVIFIMSAFFLVGFFCSYILYVTERESFTPDFPGLAYYSNAIYFTCCTMTFTGYGDFVPRSDWGYVVCMITSVLGIQLTSMMLTSLLTTVRLGKQERIVADEAKLIDLSLEEREVAGRLIKMFMLEMRASGKLRKYKKMVKSAADKQKSVKGSKEKEKEKGVQDVVPPGICSAGNNPLAMMAQKFKRHHLGATSDLGSAVSVDFVDDVMRSIMATSKDVSVNINNVFNEQVALEQQLMLVNEALIKRIQIIISTQASGSTGRAPVFDISEDGDVVPRTTMLKSKQDVNCFLVA